MKCGWCYTDSAEYVWDRLWCRECGAMQLAHNVGVWTIPRRESEHGRHEQIAFNRGACVAFGLMGMAEAIRASVGVGKFPTRMMKSFLRIFP